MRKLSIGALVKIKPLTHKTKNRVKNHGDEWEVLQYVVKRFYLFKEVSPKDPDEPFCFWGEPGVDFEVIE